MLQAHLTELAIRQGHRRIGTQTPVQASRASRLSGAMAGTVNNGAMEPLRSGTSMNWRMHDKFTQGILADGFGIGGETMYGDLIFSHHPTQNQDWLIGRGGQEGCLDE